MIADGCTRTLTSEPDSVVKVIELPVISFTVPTDLAGDPGDAACPGGCV